MGRELYISPLEYNAHYVSNEEDAIVMVGAKIYVVNYSSKASIPCFDVLYRGDERAAGASGAEPQV